MKKLNFFKGNTLPNVLLVSISFVLSVSFFVACKKRSIPEEPKPDILISVTPSTTISYGGSATVSWTATNAITVTSSVGERTPVILTNLTKDTLVTVSAVGPGGSITKNLKITVAPLDPTIKLLVDPIVWKLSKYYQWEQGNDGVFFFKEYQANPCYLLLRYTFYPNGDSWRNIGANNSCYPNYPIFSKYLSWSLSADKTRFTWDIDEYSILLTETTLTLELDVLQTKGFKLKWIYVHE